MSLECLSGAQNANFAAHETPLFWVRVSNGTGECVADVTHVTPVFSQQ